MPQANFIECKALGADVVINYKSESFVDRVLEATDKRGADVILDFVGAPYWSQNLSVAALYGRLMLIGFLGGSQGQLDLGMIMGKSLTVVGTTLRRTPLDRKVALVDSFSQTMLPHFATGELRPVIHSIYPLSEAAEGHKTMENNSYIGKIVFIASE